MAELVEARELAARSQQEVPIDFASTQQMSPSSRRPGGGRCSSTTSPRLHQRTAFSPTDVMPLTHRAKYTMLVQSTVAHALFGLIVARAVNAFT